MQQKLLRYLQQFCPLLDSEYLAYLSNSGNMHPEVATMNLINPIMTVTSHCFSIEKVHFVFTAALINFP